MVITALIALTLAPGAQAQDDLGICIEPGFNAQCNDFGSIKMENQRDIKGDTIVMTITAQVNETYEDAGARWILFSVRHVPEFGSSPVSLALEGFRSQFGDVYVTNIEQDVPNELNVWLHVVDVPRNTTLELDVAIGAADRGAFRLEALAMPFDRGYEPIADENGQDRILYTFSLLGVNQETGAAEASDPSPSSASGRPVPLAPWLVGAAVLGAALILRRRA